MFKAPSGTELLNPAELLERLDLTAGMRVADLGCGGAGYFTIQAAKMVTDEGLVYAVDIYKLALSALYSKAATLGVNHIIHCVWSNLEVIGGAKKITSGSLDAAILNNVLHQTKFQLEVLMESARMLKTGGRLLILDWRTGGHAFGPKPNEVISLATVKKLAAKADLAEFDSFEAGVYHWGLIVAKAG
ncbi:MAG: methyltransferase domain-containing protein [Patescibacteria group bacterium]